MTLIHYSKKATFLIAGGISLLLGLIGLLLPLVPQVPFLLLAVYCLARGSSRLQRWFQETPRLEPLRRLWKAHEPKTPAGVKRLQVLITVGIFAYAFLGIVGYYVYLRWFK